MTDISIENTPNLLVFYQDFTALLFFTLYVIIGLLVFNLLIKMTSHKKDD